MLNFFLDKIYEVIFQRKSISKIQNTIMCWKTVVESCMQMQACIYYQSKMHMFKISASWMLTKNETKQKSIRGKIIGQITVSSIQTSHSIIIYCVLHQVKTITIIHCQMPNNNCINTTTYCSHYHWGDCTGW